VREGGDAYDVVVIGEVLVELSTTAEGLHDGQQLRLAFSGDALNSAAAAAAAGARTALLTRVADDELGDALLERVADLDVATALVRRVPGQQGFYLVRSDPSGAREFVYSRRGSAASTLEPEDIVAAGLEDVGVVLTSGITAALSATTRAAVLEAALRADRFIYDPNYRPRLTSVKEAAAVLAAVAPRAELVSPAWPDEARQLLGADSPEDAAARCRALGAAAAAVPCGAAGVLLDDGRGAAVGIPAPPAPALVDQTGAGDALLGTVAARLALGDPLAEAVRLGCAAASLCLQGQGGLGFVATLDQARAHLAAGAAPPATPTPQVATTASGARR